MNTPSSVEGNTQKFDPLSTVRQIFSYDEENGLQNNSNYSKLESLKQRISDLCRLEVPLLSMQDTRSCSSSRENTLSSWRGVQRPHTHEKLEVKRDKLVSMRNFYSSLMDFTKEKARISLRELRSFRDEIVETIDRQFEDEQLEIVRQEKDILQDINDSYDSCNDRLEEISSLIKKIAASPNNLQLMNQYAAIINSPDPEPMLSFADVKFESSFIRSDKAVQTEISEISKIELEYHLQDEYSP